jgi:activator of Hsp90 ATPase-like protein
MASNPADGLTVWQLGQFVQHPGLPKTHFKTTRLEKIMTNDHYTAAFSVDQSADEVFAAINNVRGWWTGDIEGGTDKLGDEFTYRYEDLHRSKQKITELVPDKKVVWLVLDANLKFNEDPSEWAGSEITFEVAPNGGKTEVRFAHVGLVPEFECFDACSSGWNFFINGSLRTLITTGGGPSTPPWA